MLRITNLCKSYSGVHALSGASFELCAGEVHALVGENGAGKSTLISVITGAVTADSGSIELDGKPISHNSPRWRTTRSPSGSGWTRTPQGSLRRTKRSRWWVAAR